MMNVNEGIAGEINIALQRIAEGDSEKSVVRSLDWKVRKVFQYAKSIGPGWCKIILADNSGDEVPRDWELEETLSEKINRITEWRSDGDSEEEVRMGPDPVESAQRRGFGTVHGPDDYVPVRRRFKERAGGRF